MKSLPPVIVTSTQRRILVVDDEEIIVASLREILSRENFQVFTALDARTALELLGKETFALVLSDQRMPEMEGLALLAEARKLQPDATRILMTGVLNLDTVVNAINHGEIYRFIVKPWLREELVVTVQNGVQRHELLQRNAQLQVSTLAMNEQLAALNRSLEAQVTRETAQNKRLADLNEALQQNFRYSIELCLHTMQTFCPGLGAQARRVHELCRSLADGLALPPEERQVLEISAWLHDIGLVGVPRRIIRLWQKTPQALNPAELALVQQHPALGEELAAFIHQLAEVGKVIRAHHERFDGRGYPDGLAGQKIPWLARLLSVAIACAESDDAYAGLDAIQRESGRAFDPEAVRVLLRHRPHAVLPRKEQQVMLAELRAGMIVAKGIYGANGLLLVPEGQVLSDLSIEKLRNHSNVNSIKQSLLVYC
ncbi:MAG: hypothetical protein QOF48_3825 [Verrucomicrobiota bacterium]|jgi:response regulator RpfG family c-di-GMP phosphodiesterase